MSSATRTASFHGGHSILQDSVLPCLPAPIASVVDHFEVLSLRRCAALNEEDLSWAYLEKSRLAHPDQGGNEEAAAQVNAAFEVLRAPEKRLKHLIEIQAPTEAKAWRTVPMDESMMTLFSSLSRALESSGKFLEQKSKAQSALAKALLANEEFSQRDTLENLGLEIERYRERMVQELPALDEALAAGATEAWRPLGIVQARFAYLARWQSQIRERLLQLM